jgi:phosphoribosylformylglycinamidine synthase subunit PurL
VAIQDLGAAGLTCAASEMAARGGTGMFLQLDAVPLRETGMRPEEILLSESQERMLLVVQAGAEDRIADIYRRWDLTAAVVGEVAPDPVLTARHHDRLIASLPPYALAEAPAYRPVAREPVTLRARWTVPDVPEAEPTQTLLQLLSIPTVASKRTVFEQYDHMVQVRTAVVPGAADAAVLRLPEVSPQALALATDCNGRLCGLDPYRGARLAVAEAAANLACVGAAPLGLTDCLNFGNPEDPEVFWMFRQAVAGLADACRALRIPVVSGNVSFYNESPDGPVPPTPVIGMVGLIADVARVCRAGFQHAGDAIVLVGPASAELAGSLYLQVAHALACGRPPDVDFDLHVRAMAVVRDAIARGWARSAHDCSDGGLAVALAESAILGDLGAEVTVPVEGRVDAALFGEAPSRFVLSLSQKTVAVFHAAAAAQGVPAMILGRVTGERLRITTSMSGPCVIDVPLSQLATAYDVLSGIL